MRTAAWLVGMTVGLGAGALGALSCGEQFDTGPAAGAPSVGGSGGVTGSGGATTASTTGAGGVACNDFNSACYGCGRDQCPDLYCGCVNDGACLALVLCVAPCAPSNTTCLQPCYAENADYVSSAALLSDCLGTVCATDCVTYQPLPECRRCMFESCPSQMNACLADAACTELLLCAEACPGPACVTSCYQAATGGTELATSVQECLNLECPTECPWGVDPDAGSWAEAGT